MKANSWLASWRALHQRLEHADLAAGASLLAERDALIAQLPHLRFADLHLLADELDAALRTGDAVRARWQSERVVDGSLLLSLMAEQQQLLAFAPAPSPLLAVTRSWVG
jgi:predicted negative regulator of RcsB-dependent stress response